MEVADEVRNFLFLQMNYKLHEGILSPYSKNRVRLNTESQALMSPTSSVAAAGQTSGKKEDSKTA